MKLNPTSIRQAAVALLFAVNALLIPSSRAQGTAFSYQGQLQNGTNFPTGTYDLSFTLYINSSGGVAVAGPVTNLAVGVTNGLFTTIVSFPGNPFTGGSNWLELAVRTNGAASFSPPLAPRQQLTPTPYAVFAETANAAGLTGTLSGSGTNLTGVAFLAGGNTLTGQQTFTGNASGVGGGGSIDPSVFLRVNNSATDGNTSSPDVAGIAFGNNSTRQAIVGGTYGNDFLDFYTGGLLTVPKVHIDYNGHLTVNDPRTGSDGSGGEIDLNDFYSGSSESALIDTIGHDSSYSWRNGALELRPVSRLNVYKGFTVTSSSQVALTVIGSSGNVGIGTTSPDRPLAITGTGVNGEWISLKDTNGTTRWHLNNEFGGMNFVLTGVADYRLFLHTNGNVGIHTVSPGGPLAVATSNGTFTVANGPAVPELIATGGSSPGHIRFRNAFEVWPDTNAANAGYLDVRNTNGTQNIILDGSVGEITCVALNLTSDRNAKEEFQPVDARAVLEKVASLPISEWQYKKQSDSRHIGPMAQDFREAFALGHDDKHISMVDESGVALAAIQGLNEKLEETRAENAELKRTVNDLKQLVEQLKQHPAGRKAE